MTSPVEDFKPGDRFLESFRIEGVLGRGGMGEVYLATDEWMEREVAIKLIQRKYADRPDFVERFRRETKALAKLEHRNIVRLYAAGKADDGRLYMIMERLRGLSLRKIIETARRLDLGSAIHYGIQIAEAVSIVHAKGILHRDIKPENILVGAGGHVWVLDFGLAKATATTVHTDEKKEIGTTRYMSPEQIRGHRTDERADLYAIGIVLYEMLAGCHPYPLVDESPDIGEAGLLSAHLFTEARPLAEILPECPAAVWEVVSRCLAKDRDARHPNAEALATDLRAVLRDGVPADPPPAQRLTREQDEARSPAARKAGGAKLSREASTEPLPQGFGPAFPPPGQQPLGQGYTIKMAPMPGASVSSAQAAASAPTAPLPSMEAAFSFADAPTAPLPPSARAEALAREALPASPSMPRAPLPSMPEAAPRLPLPFMPEAAPRPPLPSPKDAPRPPLPSPKEVPPSYSFTQPGQPVAVEVPGAPQPAAQASAPPDLSPAPAPAQVQKKPRSIAAPIVAGLWLAAVVCVLGFFVLFLRQPAAPAPEETAAAAPAVASSEPLPAPSTSSEATGEASAATAPAPPPASSPAVPAAAPMMTATNPAVVAVAPPPPKPAPVRPVAAPSASAKAAPAPPRGRRLWLDADAAPSAIAKPGPAKPAPVTPLLRSKEDKR